MEKDVEKRSGISKATGGLVVCAVLIIILAVSNVWFYAELQGQIGLRARAYDSNVVESQYTNSEGAETPFFFYYVKPELQKFGVHSLDNELEGLKWSRQYDLGLFDCTEMTAYLERYLENNGWHAQIVVGDTPFGPGRHAWLLVETSEGSYMPVESTTIQIVWWSAPSFDNYWVFDYRFETIGEALSYSETAFDWWTVYPQ
ncbi:MAG: hypothetical protein NWE77_02605 [Candidatus Bathyarchaeota archaeon]|nr:hypothetical protein [Candidatus Bathyarchaeota archaeon]MCW4001818.1 hypothetical protein [Candidatus Bathyarchaeota archaeon]MCZ2807737.1 hypothetical protein [Candidatus Bathyarchaeota archaeon]